MTSLTEALVQEFKMIRAAVAMPGAGGAVYDAVLPANRCLTVGDTIVSANGMFFAIMEADGRLRVYRGAGIDSQQGCLWESARSADGGRFFALVQSDGNFCIYKGTDLAHNEGWHWGTQLTAEGGKFYGQLEDDGVFSICKGADPTDYQGTVWSSGASDPVARIDDITSIAYHLDGAKLLGAQPSDLYRETVNNNNEQIQTSLISGSVSVSDTTGWSDELAAGALSPVGFKGPVPVVSGGKVLLSTDAGHGYIRNGAATVAKTWGFNAPAAVPPNSSMMCLVSAIRSAIVVPYTLSGYFTLASGARVPGTVRGTFSGSNCHDLSVTLTTYDPDPAGSYTVSRPLTPMPSIVGLTTPHPIEAQAYYQA